jgi:ankyrin repeat protein
VLDEHLELGVDVYRDEDSDWRAFDVARVYGHTECARLLIDHNADVNAKTEYGSTALHCATDNSGTMDCVKLLVQHGAVVNCQTNVGWTPPVIFMKIGESRIIYSSRRRTSTTTLLKGC